MWQKLRQNSFEAFRNDGFPGYDDSGDYRVCTKDVNFNPDAINIHLGKLLNSRDPSHHQSYPIDAIRQQ